MSKLHEKGNLFRVAYSRQRALEAINSITFPTTAEVFIAAQEAWTGRKLTEREREVAEVAVDLMGVAYQDGADGEENTLTLDDVRRFYAERDKEDSHHITAGIWQSICWWCERAYQAGRKARGEA